MPASSDAAKRPAVWETAAAAALILTGLGLAAAKAATAAITTDEAWNNNDWISRGFAFIGTDYSHPNNHMLCTLLAKAATVLFGDTVFVQRLPALAGFGLLLVSCRRLSLSLVQQTRFRLLLLAGVALHPYLIDFGACARGYSLGLGFSMAAVALLAGARTDGIVLATASALFGLAVGSVPLFAEIALGAVASWAWLRAGALRRSPARILACLALPGSAVLLTVYGGVIDILGRQRFSFGARGAWSSLASLHALFVYTPQSLLDSKGNPLAEGPLLPWKQGVLPDSFHAVTAAPAFRPLLAALALFAVVVAVRRSRQQGSRMVALPGLALGATVAVVLVQSLVLHVPWPLHRTWFPVFGLFLVALPVGLSIVADRSGALGVVRRLATAASVALLLGGMDRIDLHVYREWPDNAPLPDVVATLEREHGRRGGRLSLGHPWYQDACFRYYRAHRGDEWLVLAARPADAEIPGWADYMLVSPRMKKKQFAAYTNIERYQGSGLVLMRRAS